MSDIRYLSKSRYTRGLQCEKLLWLSIHEPNAPELTPDASTQVRFDTGSKVGDLARSYFPGGTLIERDQEDLHSAVRATTEAIARGVAVLFEASFLVDGLFCAVDVMEKSGDSWTIVEVKSTVKVKEQHLPDVAMQVHVARKAGLNVVRAEIMVLNSECRFPNLSNLFVRHDVTDKILGHLRSVETNSDQFLATLLESTAPVRATGDHCYSPYECPFVSRCHAASPEHALDSLYYPNSKVLDEWRGRGFKVLSDLDDESASALSKVQQRQVAAVRSGQMIVEKGLKARLAKINGPVGYLDFETVAPAIPAWTGCGPYRGITAQFSYHVENGSGGYDHSEWIATVPGDPRRDLALALINACKGASIIITYNSGFEKSKIRDLAISLPDLTDDLLEINTRIDDLLPIVRDHVYHPSFNGSFSIKSVLPALCPDLSYASLAISDGGIASNILAALLTDEAAFTEEERQKSITDLKAYCALDTWAMVRLMDVLRGFSANET